MDEATICHLDPELARKTRAGHIILFILGTMLLIPAGLVTCCLLFFMGFTTRPGMNDYLFAAFPVAVVGTGVLAWSFLGLLFFKRANPMFHILAWGLVALFSAAAFLACVMCLLSCRDFSFITGALVVGLITSLAAMPISQRNFELAVRSRRELLARSRPQAACPANDPLFPAS